jgi:di/tricarboxylate transporter
LADQILVFAVLGLALALFLWGRWRYDLVALGALLALTIPGVVAPAEAFSGFGHPAVITVAAVLVISRALERSGMVSVVARWLSAVGSRPVVLVPTLTVAVTLASGFMNNVGALALLMPVSIRLARDARLSPSVLLMPLAFGSLLGGLLTLIGTPSNIVIGTYRSGADGAAFLMFDFFPAGAVIALVGLAFISLVGWRLVPRRRADAGAGEMFHIQDYLSELTVTESSRLVGRRLSWFFEQGIGDTLLIGLVRDGDRIEVPSRFETVRSGDRLVVRTGSDALQRLIEDFDLELAGHKGTEEPKVDLDKLTLIEAVVAPGSRVLGRSAEGMRLRTLFGVNLLAVSRRGETLRQRPSRVVLQTGDVILLQGDEGSVKEAIEALGLLPLAERSISLGQSRRLLLAASIFAVAVFLTASGVLEVQVALMAGAVAMVLARLIRVDEAYQAIDWPVVVLIGAMIPVGLALETTGGAGVIAEVLESVGSSLGPMLIIGFVILVVMALSNVINNAAAAVVMAPVAIRLAEAHNASIDPFLMAVAVGAALPLFTPIGHQSNVLVMGPGGYRFGDYWRLGLPVSILVLLVGPPAILWAWPF